MSDRLITQSATADRHRHKLRAVSPTQRNRVVIT